MKLLVIIPIRNKEHSVLEIIRAIENDAPGIEYMFIDYGSTDRTRHLLLNNDINRLELPIKGTYEDALSLGIEYAYDNKYDFVIQFDAFKGLYPIDLLYFIKTMEFKRNDFILGSRFVDGKIPHKFRHLYVRVLRDIIFMVTGNKVSDPGINFRMLSRDVMKEIINGDEGSLTPASIAHLIRAGYKYTELQITKPDKKIRQASVNKLKLVRYVGFQTLTILFVQPFRKRGK